ncbi:MAG TPA: glycoside hydrolase family 1 protein [Clostridiaceae bacterium]|nr:glycoside hydrolase family 1 protein [Clostridiaceae bacterium]
MEFRLKPGLLLGAASAATQIEGGELGHNWNDWYARGNIKDRSNPARSTDHYNLWKEDADLMASMGLQIYRFGIEWARICPTEDMVDESAIAHYREEMEYLQKKGIKLLLTIHHFTNPMWFEKKGGFTKVENIRHFLDLVKLVVESFGDMISEYITINEPNVYATSSFFFGEWPPGEKSFARAMKVMSVMTACHIEAYKLIHKMRKEMGYDDTKVSFAHHMRVFDPENHKNLKHRITASMLDRFFQDAITEAMYLGKFKWPIKNYLHVKPGEYCDFIALNYYTRTTVYRFGDGVKKDAPKNDLGWEVYPQGIIRCAEKLYNVLKRPIYITENGTCDNKDIFRCRYIYDHLKTLCSSELPIERYYHWCFCDNFEWLEGESARFGLVYVDYETQARTIKRSGEFFSEIIRAGGVTKEIYDEYVKNQQYHY